MTTLHLNPIRSKNTRSLKRSRRTHIHTRPFLLALLSLTLFTLLTSCADEGQRLVPWSEQSYQRYEKGTTSFVSEPYPTTTQNYSPNQSNEYMSIENLLDLIKPRDHHPWYGLSTQDLTRYQQAFSQCGTFNNDVVDIGAPKKIKGVVTYHPRYYKKVGFCGFDVRTYGSFWIQDSTGGILVRRDSRIADFDIGDEVSINVRGLAKLFGTSMVLLHDKIDIINHSHGKTPIYTQNISMIDPEKYYGQVVTIQGEVVVPPTNINFNSACLVPIGGDKSGCEGDCLNGKSCPVPRLFVSVDREIGQRNPYPIKAGAKIEVTGPISSGYNGPDIAISRVGQYKFIN